jgi:hypothetical protein
MADRAGEKKDKNGGLVPEALHRAKHVDLITLPRGIPGTNCGSCRYFRGTPHQTGHCNHREVNMDVNYRMCCCLWDAHGVIRAWES